MPVFLPFLKGSFEERLCQITSVMSQAKNARADFSLSNGITARVQAMLSGGSRQLSPFAETTWPSVSLPVVPNPGRVDKVRLPHHRSVDPCIATDDRSDHRRSTKTTRVVRSMIFPEETLPSFFEANSHRTSTVSETNRMSEKPSSRKRLSMFPSSTTRCRPCWPMPIFFTPNLHAQPILRRPLHEQRRGRPSWSFLRTLPPQHVQWEKSKRLLPVSFLRATPIGPLPFS